MPDYGSKTRSTLPETIPSMEPWIQLDFKSRIGTAESSVTSSSAALGDMKEQLAQQARELGEIKCLISNLSLCFQQVSKAASPLNEADAPKRLSRKQQPELPKQPRFGTPLSGVSSIPSRVPSLTKIQTVAKQLCITEDALLHELCTINAVGASESSGFVAVVPLPPSLAPPQMPRANSATTSSQGSSISGNSQDAAVHVGTNRSRDSEKIYELDLVARLGYNLCWLVPRLAGLVRWNLGGFASLLYQTFMIAAAALSLFAFVWNAVDRESQLDVVDAVSAPYVLSNFLSGIIHTTCASGTFFIMLCCLVQGFARRPDLEAMRESASQLPQLATSIRRGAFWDSAVTLLLASVAVVYLGCRADVVGQHNWSVVLAFIFLAAEVSLISLYLLQVCRQLQGLVETFMVATATDCDFPKAVTRWSLIQAIISRSFKSTQYSFAVLSLVSASSAMIALAKLIICKASYAGSSTIPYVFLLCIPIRMMFRAAALTDLCERVPAFLTSITTAEQIDDKRMYLVQHVQSSRSGFVAFDTSIGSALLYKLFYVGIVATIAVATRIQNSI